ncbi:ABC1 kinase family protein [Panacagrimonas sp.]|uniref:ABC1 kinase family protein n=1 Tax=Panacagrimonas sp. TaxID=2480088 RepID=UPI003B51EBD8
MSDNNSDKNAGKPGLASLRTRPFERNFALTKLGLGAGSQIVAHSIANLFRGEVSRTEADREFYRRQAEVLRDELGQLKGSVMKAGQMLSLYGQYFLPEEAVTVLSQLQDDTPAVHWRVVQPVLERALGRSRLAELEVDERPLAAASLGQAHRATRKSDGLQLVVKIQYPGVADAIESDIRTLARLISMTRMAPKGLDLAPIFAELREMLHREVDYSAERSFTQSFGERLADDPRFVVPGVLTEYCSDQVITTTYEYGHHVKDVAVQGLSQERRNALGRAFVQLFVTELFGWGMVQTDPHFGNYRIRPDADGQDRIVLLDFGATRVFGRGFVDHYANIVRGGVDRDRDQIVHGAVGIGLMDAQFPKSVLDAFCDMCEMITEPFAGNDTGRVPARLLNAQGEYKWGDSDLPMRAGQLAAKNAFSKHFRLPPREIVFLHRRLSGVFIMLATLHAEVDARPLLLDVL